MPDFKDNFSAQSATYRTYRPTYPDKLFRYLRLLMKSSNLAWDCSTGNGQAAIGLTPYVDAVVATDPSAEQVANAMPHQKITYTVENPETPSLANGSVDLMTVAQALHWFDFDAFKAAAKRVLIKIWCYHRIGVWPAVHASRNSKTDSAIFMMKWWVNSGRPKIA